LQSKSTQPIVILLGPTAVGKTGISLILAERLQGEIIVADAVQVYKYMDIGTGKPTSRERQKVPHHLLDLVEPDEPFNAGDFSRLAQAKLEGIRERKGLPLVVGGCGLYIRALVDGLFSGPSGLSEIRKRYQEEAKELGGEALHKRLATIDPVSACKIQPRDTFRIIRALEIYEATGKRPSEVRGVRWARRRDRSFLFIGLWRPRPSLYRLIEERIDSMIRAGFLEEVQSLLARFSADCKPFRGLGYRHMMDHLNKGCDFEKMVSLWKRDTRHYAKRQLTWFSRDDRVVWIPLEGGEAEACGRIQALIQAEMS